MSEGKGLQNMLLVSGLVGLLVLGLVFDLIIRALVERNAQTGMLDVTLVWLFPLLQFLFMAAVVGLVWLMIAGGGYSRWVSVVFLLVGLLVLYTNPILYTNELPDSFYVVVEYLAPGSVLFQAGGAAAAIGLLSLWFWKEPQAEVGEVVEQEKPEISEGDAEVRVD